MKLLLSTVLASCVASAGCALEVATEREQQHELQQQRQALANTFMRGKISFTPDYVRSSGAGIGASVGQIPSNTDAAADMPLLFVCAIDRDGARADADPVYNPVDDDVLGCAQTDTTGTYEIDIVGHGLQVDTGNVYLVTWFCDKADEPLRATGAFSPEYPDDAQLCVRMNLDVNTSGTDATPEPAARKFLRSPERAITAGSTSYLNWNLSCPSKGGSLTQVQEIACAAAEEQPNASGSIHSNQAWNKEFTHVFRSVAEVLKTFNNVVPKSNEVATTGCGVSGTDACAPCKTVACTDEINVMVRQAVVAGHPERCGLTVSGNSSVNQREICIDHGANGWAGTRNPFRTVHEVGHAFHRRWMGFNGSMQLDCGNPSWSAGTDEAGNTSEGFANFVAVASWWNDNMTGMEYDGRDVQNGSDAALAPKVGTPPVCNVGSTAGEGRVTQFFVDLWDNDADETANLDFNTILRVWSTFDQANEHAECTGASPNSFDRDSRNVRDFTQHYATIRATYGWPFNFGGASELNCMNLQVATGSATCGVCSVAK